MASIELASYLSKALAKRAEIDLKLLRVLTGSPSSHPHPKLGPWARVHFPPLIILRPNSSVSMVIRCLNLFNLEPI